jgi:hypothetical protein
MVSVIDVQTGKIMVSYPAGGGRPSLLNYRRDDGCGHCANCLDGGACLYHGRDRCGCPMCRADVADSGPAVLPMPMPTPMPMPSGNAEDVGPEKQPVQPVQPGSGSGSLLARLLRRLADHIDGV